MDSVTEMRTQIRPLLLTRSQSHSEVRSARADQLGIRDILEGFLEVPELHLKDWLSQIKNKERVHKLGTVQVKVQRLGNSGFLEDSGSHGRL